MGKIREPWASGFGYGGLAKKIYSNRRTEMPTSERIPEQQECRESAYTVFIRKAERLEKRAMGYRAIAHLIKTGGLTETEDNAVWTVGAFEE
jgi:hypothetical protein